jgi:hypothetical protein
LALAVQAVQVARAQAQSDQTQYFQVLHHQAVVVVQVQTVHLKVVLQVRQPQMLVDQTVAQIVEVVVVVDQVVLVALVQQVLVQRIQ